MGYTGCSVQGIKDFYSPHSAGRARYTNVYWPPLSKHPHYACYPNLVPRNIRDTRTLMLKISASSSRNATLLLNQAILAIDMLTKLISLQASLFRGGLGSIFGSAILSMNSPILSVPGTSRHREPDHSVPIPVATDLKRQGGKERQRECGTWGRILPRSQIAVGNFGACHPLPNFSH